MNKKTTKEKVLSAKKKFEEKIEKLYFQRGRIEILDELFNELSDKQKEYSVITVPGERRFVHEWWKGMTVIEKKAALIDLVKIESREGEKNA